MRRRGRVRSCTAPPTAALTYGRVARTDGEATVGEIVTMNAGRGTHVRSLVGAFGWLFGLGVVALVARYGFISSDNQVNGGILAFLFAGLAAGGLFGHAVAVRIWRIHRGWSIALGLICVAALVLNISNSLGAIAGRDDKTIAERGKIKETRADDRADLKRLAAEREAMPKFVATTAEGVRAARDAVGAAEAIRQRECGNGDPKQRGPKCRDRETEEQTKREALERVLIARGLTERADKLEVEMRRLRERLDKSDAVRAVNPQGAILTKLFSLPDSDADMAATWQQFAMAIVVDLLIMACFIAHEVMGWEARHAKRAETAAETDSPPLALPVATVKPRLVASAPKPAGGVREFIATALEVSLGAKVGMTAAYLAYVARCKARGRSFVSPEQFFEATEQICRQNGIPIEFIDSKPHIMNVQLLSQTVLGGQSA